MAGTEKTIHLKIGDCTELRYKGSGAGGYVWVLSSSNESLIRVTKDFELAGEPIPGASAEEIFKIEALKPGEVILHFTQQRIWDEGVPPRKEEKVVLHIT